MSSVLAFVGVGQPGSICHLSEGLLYGGVVAFFLWVCSELGKVDGGEDVVVRLERSAKDDVTIEPDPLLDVMVGVNSRFIGMGIDVVIVAFGDKKWISAHSPKKTYIDSPSTPNSPDSILFCQFFRWRRFTLNRE